MKRKVVLGAVLVVVATLATFLPGFNGAQAATSVPGAPRSATSFPVVGAAGVKWEPPSDNLDSPPESYVVMRQRKNGHWEDISGPVDPSVHHWIDANLQPGESHEYYVVARNEVGASQTSGIITATRPLQDPVTGSVNALTIDVNPGYNGISPLTNEVATSVVAGQPEGVTRTLSAGDIQVTLPALLPGPGSYVPVFRLRQGEVDCGVPDSAKLTITQLAYTADLQIALMSGWFSFWPCGAGREEVVGEIRVNSTEPYSAISVSSYSVDFGRVLVGTTAGRPITITNAGTTDLTIARTELTSGYSDRWGVRDDCSAPLPPASSCTMTITFKATTTYQLDAWFRIFDSTRQEYRHIRAVAAGESPPSAPDSVEAVATLTGVDLSWTGPSQDGARPVQGFVVRRHVDNTITEYKLPADRHQWIDPDLTPGAFYSVSAVNELGEGPRTFPIEPAPSREQIAVFSAPTGADSTLGAVGIWGGIQVVPIGSDAPSSSRAELAVSPDGRSLAYTTAEGENIVLWTRRAGGPGSHPVTRVVTAAAIHTPAWSPDGTRIAYTTKDGTASCVDIVPATGGVPARVGCSLDFPVWHPDAQSLIVRDSRISGAPLARVAARANGTRIAILSGANGATHAAASPDGRWLAFVPAGQSNRVGIMPLTGGTARLSAELPPSSILRVSWRPDANQLGVLSRQSGLDRIHAVPVSAGVPDMPRLLLQSASDQTIHDLQWQGLATLIKPTPGVTGPSPSIAFDTSGLQSGSTITCQIDERAPVSCASPYRPTGLTSGPHTLRVIAQEPGGPTFFGRKVVAARAFTVDATAPAASIVAPTFAATVAPSATVTYTATDSSGVASYDLRYRTASSSGAFSNYVYPKAGTTGRSYVLALAGGYEYCVSVRARDLVGNTSAWTAERCFSRPLDDRSLSAGAGWIRGTAAGLYYSTSTSSTRYDASLTRAVKMKRAYLLATKCSACGVVAVYLGTRYLTTINLYAATTQRQVLIGIPAQTSAISGTLRIATRSTGKLVQIDGLAIRQT
ncbi:WD40 repeat protein [Kribbella orskensis]|uniref:WD40 repeat protein n=1 Tax=Kribbella orskensis TaxID=2512216 RepID=A0ABY2BM57_9ACTN|nr:MULTISPECIES: fibronectin type III domain-containing protein [Kribbella]TCN41217.1 WD40 repeat protein [Kribbella sp. VKM Ac-2500]TCO24469.1 WD40 repeat protein [Kribbella orskensis]